MEKSVRRKLFIELGIVLFIAFYVSFFDPSVFMYKNDNMVGYLDTMEQIRPLDDMLSWKIPYKDFYFQYGPFYSLIQLPGYLLFGQNHNALFITWTSYLPFIGILLSFLWAAVFFKTSFYRIIFVILCIFQNVSCYYASIRHLAAEIAIAVFILSLRDISNRKLIFLSGILSGSALLTSQEYGIACVVTILFTICILTLIFRKIHMFKTAVYYVFGILTILAPFYIFLAFNGALDDYFKFSYGYAKNFANPASNELFPIFPVLHFASFSIFLKSLRDFFLSRDLRFYLPLITYVAAFGYFFRNCIIQKKERAAEIFVLAFFGLLIYYRVLSGPAYGYLTYGFIPFITLGLLFVRFIHKTAFANRFTQGKPNRFIFSWLILAGIYVWLILTNENKNLLNIFSNLNMTKRLSEYRSGKVYYSPVGFFISPKSVEQYTAINGYINANTDPWESVFVYPWGPYNHFTKRPSPVTARDTYDFMAGGFVLDRTLKQLEIKKPRYVILNTFNDGGNVHISGKRGDVGDSAGWDSDDSPSFSGKGDKLQTYILENYQLEKKFDYAAVMVRRKEPKTFERRFYVVYSQDNTDFKEERVTEGLIKFKNNNSYKITAKKSYLEYRFRDPVECSHAEIILKLNSGYFKKLFSKSFVTIYLKSNDAVVTSVSFPCDLMSYDQPQTSWIGFSQGKTSPISSIKIELISPDPYMPATELQVEKMLLLHEKEMTKKIILDTSAKTIGTPALEISTKDPENTDKYQEINNVEVQIIGSTVKTLAKAFVGVVSIKKLKKYNIKKLDKMSDNKFKTKYEKTYKFLNDLPVDIKKRFDIKETMTRQEAIVKTEGMDKKMMYELIDAIPNIFIAQKFNEYFSKEKQDQKNPAPLKNNLISKIKEIWQTITLNSMSKSAKP